MIGVPLVEWMAARQKPQDKHGQDAQLPIPTGSRGAILAGRAVPLSPLQAGHLCTSSVWQLRDCSASARSRQYLWLLPVDLAGWASGKA